LPSSAAENEATAGCESRLSTVNVEIRLAQPGDERLIQASAAGVFDHTPQADLTTEFLCDPRHHLVLAVVDGRIVGFVSAVHYVHPDKSAELWINEVAVAPAHRDHRVGRSMLEQMLTHGRRLRCRCAWVLTDRANGPAVHLYAAAGGVPEPTPSVLFEFDLTAGDSNVSDRTPT
jgi:aminoglycoside 6'-N-acetyltransferase I